MLDLNTNTFKKEGNNNYIWKKKFLTEIYFKYAKFRVYLKKYWID